MSTWLVRAEGATLLTSTAKAENFSGVAIFDCAAGRATTATAAASAAARTVRIETSNAPVTATHSPALALRLHLSDDHLFEHCSDRGGRHLTERNGSIITASV